MMFVFWMLCALLAGEVSAKYLNKCKLARFLEDEHAIKREDISVWVCIVRMESRFNTKATNIHNEDFSRDYGLFQINSMFWCADDIEGHNLCNMSCTDLLDDNIADDVKCALYIYEETEKFGIERNGFHAWTYYNSTCKDSDLRDSLEDCWPQ